MWVMKLWQKVILGLILGVVAGVVIGQMNTTEASLGITGEAFLTEYVKPVGIIFINLIKMVVIPLIFFSLIYGITSMTDTTAFKRIGIKTVVAYMLTSAFAIAMGLAFGEIFRPGDGVDLTSLLAENTAPKNIESQDISLIELFVGMVPTNIFAAMAEGNVLQVVLFSVFTAFVLNAMRDQASMIIEFIHQAAFVVFRMIETIIKFSPYGVFALTAWVVGTQGFEIIERLAYLMLVVAGALFFHYIMLGVLMAVVGRINPVPFYKKIVEAQSIAFSTSSSKATLTTVMRVSNESIGVSKTSTSFILPLGASINMDGTAIYLGITAVFFSQAFGMPLSYDDYIVLILTATLGSIGAAGIPSGSLIMMGMVFGSVGLPLEGIALIAGIDRFLDMLRTTLNVTSDAAIATIIDKSEGTWDEATYFDESK